MLCPIFRKIYSFMEAGGGVRGRGDGIALAIIIEDGLITKVCHLFTDMFLPVGETITKIVNGKGIDGNIKECLIKNFKETGVDGKETGTGRNIIGAFRNFLKKNILQKGEWIDRTIGMINRSPALSQAMVPVLDPVLVRFIPGK